MNQEMLEFVMNIAEYLNATVTTVIRIYWIYGRMICPSCLMFGNHKGHNVSKIEDGSKELRNAINLSAK